MELMNHQELLQRAYVQAKNSPDESNQNGALLWCPRTSRQVGNSYNHFNKVKPKLGNRDEKLARITHAEEGAIHSAWGAVGPLWMYCPWASCAECARDIINCGGEIQRLIVHTERMNLTPERWVASIKYAHDMLAEAGVGLTYVSGPIAGAPKIWVNGRKWSPAYLTFEEKE
jgi:deoxycytidylate deaminase